jgi:Tfp pilus assembly protein PilV
MTCSGNGPEDGSTLLEALVAFVILAGSVTMAFRIFGDGLQRQNASAARSEILWQAQSQLARLRALKAFAPGTTDNGNFRIVVTAVGSTETNAVRLFRIGIWDSGSTAKATPLLETIVIGKETPP